MMALVAGVAATGIAQAATLVLTLGSASASRHGTTVVVSASGDLGNSRDTVTARVSRHGDLADVDLYENPAPGFGTEVTGSYLKSVSIPDASGIKRVRVHARSGVKMVLVKQSRSNKAHATKSKHACG
jgi:hypothetical protein